ncbi:MAG TPA: hypothetical protein PLP91_00465 [Plasticicumulans sp.]|uniref:hypothetical protein n=1 Tax=Plasticicumulans sp. TaxID=2307179 RepID=UPI000FB6DB0E|nr:hypothetical protein [Plasticicumulans sp.]RTK97253.1 MAG: hypothetical protein EKK65_12915 [Xanthomonadales bacterium]HMW29866.1 hypothetical protein [Plasticicumulans sp.]HMW41702.1 hypothetical protein [Plasticicumulans sp.]HMZ09702.1 hypothetical protein [Plasticicumulans sp.]HNB88834.1 hypothetical protein [Plasticicumulans sp.]
MAESSALLWQGEMALDRREFLRVLPAACAGRPHAQAGDAIRVELGAGARLRIELGPTRERRIALLALPATVITILADGPVPAALASAFLRDFENAYRRGGG